jgi:hypothetical protein
MDEQINQHLDLATQKIRQIFNKTSDRLEQVKPGETLTVGKLSSDVGAEVGLTRGQVYPILVMMLDNYPGFKRKKGSSGGMERLIAVC